MRITHEKQEKEYDSLNQQLSDTLFGAMDKMQGVQATSKILSYVLMNAESQDKKVISTYELSSIITMIEYISEKAHLNIANIQEVLGQEEIEQALAKFKGNDIIDEYTRRDLTAQEDNTGTKEFFDKHFNRGGKNAR